MSVEPMDDLPVRQMRVLAAIFFVFISAFAIWQLASGAGLGWLLLLLANGAVALQITADATRKSAIYAAAFCVGVAAAFLGLADGLGYARLEGGLNHWLESALGAGAAGISAFRLYRQWRGPTRVI